MPPKKDVCGKLLKVRPPGVITSIKAKIQNTCHENDIIKEMLKILSLNITFALILGICRYINLRNTCGPAYIPDLYHPA